MSSKNSIKVYARLKSDTNSTVNYNVYKSKSANTQSHGEELTFSIPNYIDSRQIQNRFWFYKVFEPCAMQNEIFDVVMKPVIDSVLNGYNGTLFAYGQTGSGKTYTITGSTENYNDRGIIPRTIQRVTTLDDNHGNTHLRNLSVLPVNAETDALRLLFLGDTNRTIAETSMNQFSTRSHCIFTIHIGIKKPTTKNFRRGKLHLVDLAGSERIAKTNPSENKIVCEAKHINLSLHYLEQVILALSESKRHHIPYRNSLLTTVLRDSLGGNCLTSMIATLSLNENNFMETISTCRFGQRVALIKNELTINEETDPEQELISLKTEINLLKTQLTMFSDIDVTKRLTSDEEQECREALKKFINNLTPELEINLDMRKVYFCFDMFKKLLKSRTESQKSTPRSENKHSLLENVSIQHYKQLIKQRDNEISILINLLRNEREKSSDNISLINDNKKDGNISQRTDDEFSTITTISTPRDTNVEKFNASEKEAYNFFMNKPENTEEVNKYQKNLNEKIVIARKIASIIENVKSTIVSLRKKLDTAPSRSNMEDIISIKKQLTHYQTIYKSKMEQLLNLKNETDHIKHGLENAKIRLRNRFKEWYRLGLNDSLQKIPCRDIITQELSQSIGRFTFNIENSNQTTSAGRDCIYNLPEIYYCENMEKIEPEISNTHNHDNRTEDKFMKCHLNEFHDALEDIQTTYQNQRTPSLEEFKTSVPTSQVNSSRSSTNSENSTSNHSNSTSITKINSDKNFKEQIDKTRQTIQKFDKYSAKEILNSKVSSLVPHKQVADVEEKISSTKDASDTSNDTPNNDKAKNLEDWETFVKNLPLTGDEEVDTEIINFYKQQFGILN